MTRHTAQGTARFHESWRDHTSTARREHIFGKIQSLQAEGRAIGEASMLTAVCWGVLFLVAGTLAIAAFA